MDNFDAMQDNDLIRLCDEFLDLLLDNKGRQTLRIDETNLSFFNAFSELAKRFVHNPVKIGSSGRKWECSLTDEKLTEVALDHIRELYDTKGESFTMHIPARPDKDADLILTELIERYEKKVNP